MPKLKVKLTLEVSTQDLKGPKSIEYNTDVFVQDLGVIKEEIDDVFVNISPKMSEEAQRMINECLVAAKK